MHTLSPKSGLLHILLFHLKQYVPPDTPTPHPISLEIVPDSSRVVEMFIYELSWQHLAIPHSST